MPTPTRRPSLVGPAIPLTFPPLRASSNFNLHQLVEAPDRLSKNSDKVCLARIFHNYSLFAVLFFFLLFICSFVARFFYGKIHFYREIIRFSYSFLLFVNFFLANNLYGDIHLYRNYSYLLILMYVLFFLCVYSLRNYRES